MRIETPITIKPKQYKPYKSKFLKCYGVLLDNGEFDTQFFARGDYAFVLPIKSDFIESSKKESGKYFNVKAEADLVSVASYKNARRGRKEKNISHMFCAFLDLDGIKDVELPLTDDIIRHRCNLLELPIPKIIETSPNRYHLKFYFITPESIKKKWRIKAVQRALHEAFKDLGSDALVAEDITRLLRNESQVNSVNKKYRRENKPKVTVVEQGEFCTLEQLYRALKKHGFIRPVECQKWRSHFAPDFTPKEESRGRLIAFLKANQGYMSTYEALANTTRIALRTLKRIVSDLRQEGRLTTELVGRWSERVTRFTTKFFEVPSKEVVNSSLGVGTPKDTANDTDTGESAPDESSGKRTKESSLSFGQAFELAKSGGLPVGVRNFAIFGFSLWLKVVKKKTSPEIVSELESVFVLTVSPTFSRREFLTCVDSACRDSYRYCISAKKFEKVFLSLGVLDSH